MAPEIFSQRVLRFRRFVSPWPTRPAPRPTSRRRPWNAGYADQPHLTRETVRLAACPPPPSSANAYPPDAAEPGQSDAYPPDAADPERSDAYGRLFVHCCRASSTLPVSAFPPGRRAA